MNISYYFEKEFKTVMRQRLNFKMGEYCLKIYKLNFTKERYLDGNGTYLNWASLKPVTIAIKTKKGKGNYPINFDTGKLKNSFHIDYHNNGFTISNNCEYAPYVQEVRPILYQDLSIDKEMIKYIDKECQEIFKNMFKKMIKK